MVSIQQHATGGEPEAIKVAPWFVTFNRHVASPHSVRTFVLFPFPAQMFCEQSPFEDHTILAHAGVEPYARQAGFASAEQYLQWRIHDVPKRGDFCQTCPNQSCAEGR